MRNVVYLFIFIFITSCSSVKRSEKKLYKGNYDDAIRLSIKKIQKNRNTKNSKQHIQLLEDAFQKVVLENSSRIALLEKDGNSENTGKIYDLYQSMEYRQKLIRPLLPLPNASFKIEDYSDRIVTAKRNYINFLFEEGTTYLKKNSILDARTAHGYFSKLKNIQPSYDKIDELLDEAHYKGTDFVYVTLMNKTDQVIPERLEQDILNFNTYKLDNFWTEYHSSVEENIDYNYGITLELREILVSPERINEKEYEREKEIQDGWKYMLDEKGNVKKDSLGNDIKVDAFKIVTAKVLVSNQYKSVLVRGEILYYNLKSNKTLNNYPIASEFIFEHIFASFRGDKKALTKEDKRLLKRQYVDFPSNEQMIFDTSVDLKNKFSRILKKQSFR